MTIYEILNDIYGVENLLALGDSEKSNAAIAALCCATKIIAKFDIFDEMLRTDFDLSNMPDDMLKLYCDFLHNEKLSAERELYKRHIL